ncbi:hypothetical protein ACGFXC_37040 [Streptomyces sp. NPDC048507]|uniref:hypothetical protein n=1 Tax=Streptomyces sp. NPDC048507 TaxID=3365560 RepID=UPI00371C6923
MSRAQDAADLGALLSSATQRRGGIVAVPAPAAPPAAAEEAGAAEVEVQSRGDRLAELESAVEASGVNFRRAQARHYREVGPALEEIRDQELYAEGGYTSWHDYLRRRWDYSEAHAYRFITMGKVVAAISPLGEQAVQALTAESQARELAPVLTEHGDDGVRRVWAKVIAEPDRKVTAKRVAQVRASIIGPVRVSPIGETSGAGKAGPDGGEVVDAEVVEEQDAAEHAAAEDVNRLFRRAAEAAELAERLLTEGAGLLSEGRRPLDLGAAVHDVSRARKAGAAVSRAEIKF